jgi:predicted PurR-regulated permease PerM
MRSLLLAVLIGVGLWLAWTVRGVLVLLVVSATLAIGLSPLVEAVAGRRPGRTFVRLPRAVAVLVIYGVLIAVVVLIIMWIVPPLVRQFDDLVRELPEYTASAHQSLRDFSVTHPFAQGLDEWLTSELEDFLGNLGGLANQTSSIMRVAIGVANGIVSFVLVLVLTFYLIVDGDTVRRGALALVPPKNRLRAVAVGGLVREKIGAWLIGQLLLSTIVGSATFVGLLILGVPYPLILALVAAVGELIPMLGPIIAGVPAVIVAFFVSPLLGLLTLILYVLIQQLENHLIVPQVMRRAIDLPPVLVIVALLIGGNVLGIVGAILALPVAAILRVVIGELVATRDQGSEVIGPK